MVAEPKMILRLYVLATLLALVYGEATDIRTCNDTSFCRRLRQRHSNYELDLSSPILSESSIEVSLKNTEVPEASFNLVISALQKHTFHIYANEKKPLHERYRVRGVIDGDLKYAPLKLVEQKDNRVVVRSGDGTVTLSSTPFRIQISRGEQVVADVNARDFFNIEHLRTKSSSGSEIDPGAWEEVHATQVDSKPRGPEAIAMDVSFPGALRAYGLPEHGERLALRTTEVDGLDPYRMFNLDTPEYPLNSTKSTYGAVPVLYALGKLGTVGMFWLNSAETWIDINNDKEKNQVDAHFISESGVIDVYIFLGPTPRDAIRQYAALTGVAPLPQYFTLGYHQCRWNYDSEDDVHSVVQRMDEADFPMDVMWLDIEYTDQKMYFTWDPVNFAHPLEMQRNLTSTGRKLVVIIDPHIKREEGYKVFEELTEKGYFVKFPNGSDYEGKCWPGLSSYADFMSPDVVDYFATYYTLEKFNGSTDDMYIWNDMNEPAVFDVPEGTFPKDVIHYGGWEHRNVHNIYGFQQTVSTFKGLQMRNPNKRPFILTRSHFAGSQRYTIIWTGDNAAEWHYLEGSIAMCLTEAIAGISFCGADVGGFFRDPDTELLTRWYQTSAWLPFYREHANNETPRREPYLYSEDVQAKIRATIKLRYAHLPYWYTLFFQHERTGDPVIRPLFYHYPDEANVLDIDDQMLVGPSILVKIVKGPGVTKDVLYLPGGKGQLWYDIHTFEAYKGTGLHDWDISPERLPVFYKGGSVIFRRDTPRKSSAWTHADPYTAYAALDDKGNAEGYLYIDDGESYNYRDRKYLYITLKVHRNRLEIGSVDEDTHFVTMSTLDRIVILGAKPGITHAKYSGKTYEVRYEENGRYLVIENIKVSLGESTEIELL